jgi:ParB-like chromosome segregation protein Spo0J
MEIKKVKLTDIKLSDYNPRSISKDAYERLKTNIKEFGFIQPIILNKNLTIIGGTQRLKALEELGFIETDAVILDLNKEKEKILNIALNKISGEFDYEKLDKLLTSINKKEIELTGFTPQEIKELTIKFDFSNELKELEKLKKEENSHIDFIAKIKDKKSYEEIDKILKVIKKKNNWQRFSNEYCNGLILKELCRRYK